MSTGLVETAVLQLLVDPQIRRIAGSFVKDWMFENEVNKIAHDILISPEFDDRVPNVQAFVLRLFAYTAVTEEDCNRVALLIKSAPKLDDSSRASELKSLQQFIQDKMMSASLERMVRGTRGHSERDHLLEALHFTLSNEDEFADLSDPTALSRAKESDIPSDSGVIQSYFGLINQNLIYRGYKVGDLICYAGETGIGKSTSAVCEGAHAIDQGFKVCHVYLGDMTEFDSFIQYTSYWTGQMTERLIYDYEEYYDDKIKDKFKNLRLRAFPADSITIYELLSKLHALYKSFPFNLLIIDYDGNLKETNDNMYKEGGTTYSQLKGFSQGRCATIVLSQVNKGYWGVEVGAKDALAESSKKQHAVDYMVYVGRNPDVRRIGSLTLCKARRGRDSVTHRIEFRYKYARLVEISTEKYDELLKEGKNRSKDSGDTVVDFS